MNDQCVIFAVNFGQQSLRTWVDNATGHLLQVLANIRKNQLLSLYVANHGITSGGSLLKLRVESQ